MKDLAERVVKGEPRAIARMISLAENNSPDAPALMTTLHGSTGNAQVIGVTGVMGAGKSTLITELALEYRRMGRSVGIIAIDPTSPFSGGALLGDRIRMNDHTLDKGVFIRSMATRGNAGGLARQASELADVLDAAGFDFILFETVGVGQVELDIAAAADTTIVMIVPESGDIIQGLKSVAKAFDK